MQNKQHPIYKHLVVRTTGQVFNKLQHKFIHQSLNSNGYMLVSVEGKPYRVHRLIAETFLQDSEDYGKDVNHKDGVKTNNNLSNLEWCTRSHNIQHAIDTGLNPSKGITHHNNKYSEELVRQVCKYMEDGWRNIDIVNKLEVPKDWVAMVRTGRLWTHITKEYKISFKRKDRISPKSVHFVCGLLETGLTSWQVVKAHPELSRQTVSRIKRKEIFKDISSQYSFKTTSRLTTDMVHTVCKNLEKCVSVKQICEELDLTRFVVGKIKNKKTWTNISKHYKF